MSSFTTPVVNHVPKSPDSPVTPADEARAQVLRELRNLQQGSSQPQSQQQAPSQQAAPRTAEPQKSQAQQQRPQQAAPRTAEPQQQKRPVHPDHARGGRVSSLVDNARDAAKNGVNNAVEGFQNFIFELFVSKKRIFVMPLLFLALIGGIYMGTARFAPQFFSAWVAPYWLPVAFVCFLVTLVIYIQPWDSSWGEGFKGRSAWRVRCRQFLVGPRMRSVYALVVAGVVAALAFVGPARVAELATTKVNLGSVSLLGGWGASVAPVHLQPELGMITDPNFAMTEDGTWRCAVGGYPISRSGMFTNVTFNMENTEEGLTYVFTKAPVGLGGFIAADLPVPLTGDNAPNGSNTFVFDKNVYGELDGVTFCAAP